jgi:hypothetical protein
MLKGMIVLPAADAATEYRGICDASAAVAVEDRFFVVANDEDNTLRAYARNAPGKLVSALDVGPFLGLERRREADIEGAARLGDLVFWITSHGTNSSGAARPERRRFFATRLTVEDDRVKITPFGTPFKDLVQALALEPALARFRLGDAAMIAPERTGGLNIEGLGTTPAGELLIGFRNPIRDGKSLLVPLRNPRAIVERQPPQFGPPVLLDLGGRGVRSIDYVAALESYLIIAGPPGDDGAFRMYRWTGRESDAPSPIDDPQIAQLNPEALIVYDGPHAGLQLLSDDGGRRTGGVDCKDLPENKRKFRAVELALPR